MLVTGLLSLLLVVQDNVPFKAKDEFEIKLAYQFKEREQHSSTTSAVLPYVVLKLNLVKLNNEEKLNVDTNLQPNFLIRRHLETGKEYTIELGYASDVRDHIAASEYIFTFVSPAKKPISKIIIRVESDGTFNINGERRGKL